MYHPCHKKFQTKSVSSPSAAAATSALLPSGASALILPFSNLDSPPSRASFPSSRLPAGSCAACLLVQREAGGRAGSGARDLLPFWRRRWPPPQVASPARRAGGGDGRFAHLIAARRRNLLRVARTRVPPPGARPNAAAPPRHSSNLYMKVSFYMKENRTSIQAEFHPSVILSLSFILVLALLLPLKLPGSTASHPTRQCWFSKSGRANKLLAMRLNIQFLYLGNSTCFSGLVATTFFFLPCSIAVSP